MKKRVLVTISLFFAVNVVAQTGKISTTAKCAKPIEQHSIDVGDHPGHAFVVTKWNCTFDKPYEVAGSEGRGWEITSVTETSADKWSEHGYTVATYANGDKGFSRNTGTLVKHDQSSGTWTLTGGTGKLKGQTGKGTYKCKPNGDESICEVEGEYTLAQAK